MLVMDYRTKTNLYKHIFKYGSRLYPTSLPTSPGSSFALSHRETERNRAKTEPQKVTTKMDALVKTIDAILFVMFAITAVNAVLIDVQLCLPASFFSSSLAELKNWYVREFEDYLGKEKPHFFLGLIWVELVFQWPLLVANLYGIWAAKPWYNTTCLAYGASFFTTMVNLRVCVFFYSEKSHLILIV